jgi:hypothetical protein
VRRLAHRVSEVTLMRAGTLVQAGAFASLVGAGTVGSRGFLYVAGGLLALGNGLTQPATSAFVSRRASSERQGATLGPHVWSSTRRLALRRHRTACPVCRGVDRYGGGVRADDGAAHPQAAGLALRSALTDPLHG